MNPRSAPAKTGTLLLVSYHFPPSEAAGALRWQRLTGIAARHGLRVEALTLAPGLAERISWPRVLDLPVNTRIHGVTQPQPWGARVESFALQIRGASRSVSSHATVTGPRRPSTIHKTDIGWLSGGPRGVVRAHHVWINRARELAWAELAVKTGLRTARKSPPDLVISCGPPHGVHLAGRRLARKLGVPFVMDLRDPWSLQARLHEETASPLWFHLAARDEAGCVAEASLIVMNTPRAAAAMTDRWPGANVISVMNGWDDEALPTSAWPEQFRIVFAGSIYIDRSPRPLFRAVADAVHRLGVTPAQFEVRLIGSVAEFGGTSVEQLAAEEGAGGYVKLLPAMPRLQVLREYSEAAVLLNLPQDSHMAIPSKVFEHIRQPCWVLAQNSQESATADVLRDSTAFVVDPDDWRATADILVRCYGEFRAGRRPAPIAVEGRFSRESEGARFFAALRPLLGIHA